MIFLESNPYFSLWNKYRPVILQLMSSAVNGPQQYKLYAHEFKAVGEKERSGYSFVIQTEKGKAANPMNNSTVAKNLLQVLQQSKTGLQLLQSDLFEFSMDKQFVFHVTRKSEVKPDASVDLVAEGAK